MSIASANGRGRGYSITGSRGYASKAGKKELYSDEAGGVGAGVSLFSIVKDGKQSLIIPD